MTRLLLALCVALLLVLPSQGWGAELANDNFDRADGGLGANWTTIAGSSPPAIASNVVQDNAVGGAAANALYTAITWPDDQYATITLLTLNTTNGREASVWLRTITAAVTGYVCTANGPFGTTAQLRIRRFNAGAATAGADSGAAATVASTDVMKCTVVNSGADAIVKLYINNVEQLTWTDTTRINSGSAGIGISTSAGVVADAQLDNFAGGSIVAAAQGLGWFFGGQ